MERFGAACGWFQWRGSVFRLGLPLPGHVFHGSLVFLRSRDEGLYPAALLLRNGD